MDRKSREGVVRLPDSPRVLIVLLGAIGDVVRALPLAQRLRAAWPDGRIAWAVEPPAEPIVRSHPALNEVILFDRNEGVRAFARFLARIRDFAPDLTLDLQRHLKSGVTSWCSRAPVRIGFHWRNSREGNWFFNTHQIPPVERFSSKLEHYLLFAEMVGAPPAPLNFGLRLQGDEERRVDALLSGVGATFAALWLGSTWSSRQWFAEPTAQLCAALQERGLGVLLIGAATDVPFAEAVVRGTGGVTNLAGQTSLRDVIGILGRAAIGVGPDSGPMHIAAAVGTPVVSLWGATSPARSGPHGFGSFVVRGQAPCVPCYLKDCPIGRLCMRSITLERVLEMVDRALSPSALG